MSIIKIDNIYLYSGILSEGVEGTLSETKQSEDSLIIKTWMISNNVPFTFLNYADPNQWPAAISPLNTWFTNIVIEQFPFVIYDEIDDNFVRTKRVLQGLDEITTSNLLLLLKLSPKVVVT